MAEATTGKVHQLVAQALADHGVNTVFGVMGDANMFMLDQFIRHHGGTLISGAHESGCAVMALGYTLASGKLGVCSVTHGAAVSNTMTALIEGVKGSTPMLLVCGDTATEDRDNVQNVPQRELIVATGAGFEQLRSPRTVASDVTRAIRRAWTERRPIALNVPYELDWAEGRYTRERLYLPSRRATVSSGDDIDNAVGILAASRRPVVLAGRGAGSPEARAALLKLADRIGAPVATSVKGKDLFAGDPYNLGIAGTVSLQITVDTLLESDCLITFGASLNQYTMSHGTFAKGKRIIQVNLESEEVGKNLTPDVGLVGDIPEVVDILIRWLDEAEIPSSDYRNVAMAEAIEAQASEKSTVEQNGNGTVDFDFALEQLNRLLPDNRFYVSGGGRFMRKAWMKVRATDPWSFIQSGNSGSIGLGMSYAIGTAAAGTGRPTILIEGDGGYMHAGLAEFNTAVRHKLDLIVAICNDGAYGAEYHKFAERQMDAENCLFEWPDLAAAAIALGGEGVTVRTSSDWAAVETAIRERKGPLLIDIKLDPSRVTM